MGDVKLNSSGGGSVTLTTPSTASNYTVTLPAATSTLIDTTSTQTLTNKTLTAAGSNTVEATSGPTSSQLGGMRNKIINGAMMIDQRNAGASVTPSNQQYTLDRWVFSVGQASKLSTQRSATVPAGFSNSLLITSLSSYSVTASDNFNLVQRIEGYNVADLSWGTAYAKTVTLSFWVRCSLTGTFGGSIINNAGTRSYPFVYSISSANTWTQISVTIPGDTSGTWTTDNTSGIQLLFGLGVGSTYSGTAGSWSSNLYLSVTGATSVVGTNGATFYITGVQLEKGATATPFENRLYGTELALCQRYYQTSFGVGQRPGVDTGDNGCGSFTVINGYSLQRARGGTVFPVPMRAGPTISCYGIFSTASGTAYNFSTDATITSGVTASSISQWGFCEIGVPAQTLGQILGAKFTASAEL